MGTLKNLRLICSTLIQCTINPYLKSYLNYNDHLSDKINYK